jgi:hypothetical protein
MFGEDQECITRFTTASSTGAIAGARRAQTYARILLSVDVGCVQCDAEIVLEFSRHFDLRTGSVLVTGAIRHVRSRALTQVPFVARTRLAARTDGVPSGPPPDDALNYARMDRASKPQARAEVRVGIILPNRRPSWSAEYGF